MRYVLRRYFEEFDNVGLYMKLPGAAAVIRNHPVGKRHPTADAILLTPDADWKPDFLTGGISR